jgi:hypothetical protein
VGFVLNVAWDYVPLLITDKNGCETLAKYVQIHMMGNPFIVGCLTHNGPQYWGDIHATLCHDKEYCPTYSIQQLQYLEDNKYHGLTKALHKLGDVSLEAEVHWLWTLAASENQVVEGIRQMEHDLFYARLHKQECERRLEDADAICRLQEVEARDQGILWVTPWEVEHESHTISRRKGDPTGPSHALGPGRVWALHLKRGLCHELDYISYGTRVLVSMWTFGWFLAVCVVLIIN